MKGPPDNAYDHPAALDPTFLWKECRAERSRRSGPGGQHRNKVETAVALVHGPTGVRAGAAERRSQDQNRRVALFRLRVNLALAVRRPVSDQAYTASELWCSRRQSGAIRVNPRHQDFPGLLAEAMDVVAAHGFDVKSAAGSLGCSPTQLVKFLKLEPKALAIVNQQRKDRGLHALR